MRKTNLERLLARLLEGIFINPFERSEIGPDLSGRSKHWVEIKNRLR
jgi:bifunctional non-homologous end joining protein LigD